MQGLRSAAASASHGLPLLCSALRCFSNPAGHRSVSGQCRAGSCAAPSVARGLCSAASTAGTPAAPEAASEPEAPGAVPEGAHASAGQASSAAEPAQDAGGAAAAEVSDGEAPGAGGAGTADSGDDAIDPLDGWPTFMQDWATLYGIYRQKEDELQTQAIRRRQHDAVRMGRDRAGNVTYAADATETPLADTRVWLHMYEGASGLEYSFCRRTGAAHYMYDFTGFQQWRVERNALLSDEAKCLMFRLWRSDAALWSDTALARHFGVRVQRALAIVKIKAEEFGHADLCLATLNELQAIFGLPQAPTLDDLVAADDVHTERHLSAWFEPWLAFYELMPRLIHPESDLPAPEGGEEGGTGADDAGGGGGEDDRRVRLTREQAERVVMLHNFLVSAANSEAKHIACHEDLWRCVYNRGTREQFVPMTPTLPAFEERPLAEADPTRPGEYEALVARTAQEQDAAEIDEFRRTLAWSLGETGASIQREPRERGRPSSRVPAKPAHGWSLLVTPLHEGGRRGAPFVALPDASRRELTADEQLYLQHFKRAPKIFSRPRRHAPFTNDTLHMFTQRKPNARHDIYNPPYAGVRPRRAAMTGPTRREQRKRRMAEHQRRRDLKTQLQAAHR